MGANERVSFALARCKSAGVTRTRFCRALKAYQAECKVINLNRSALPVYVGWLRSSPVQLPCHHQHCLAGDLHGMHLQVPLYTVLSRMW